MMKTTIVVFVLLFLLVESITSSIVNNNIADQANTNLLKACMTESENDDVNEVKDALEKGANINTQEEETGQTPLMAAVITGKVNIVKYLLEIGADPTIADKDGYTPPHGSAMYGTAQVMEALIEAGIDVNTYHEDGFLPLHRTCWEYEQKYADTLRVLLRHGIPHDAKSKPNGFVCDDLAGELKIVNVLKEETGLEFDTTMFEEDDMFEDDDYYYYDEDNGIPLDELVEQANNYANNPEL